VAPALYRSWIGGPLFPQLIALPWLGNLLWPKVYDFDMLDLTREFYELFLGYKMSDKEILTLLEWPVEGEV
jgi:iron complex transport system substrate-binding protein